MIEREKKRAYIIFLFIFLGGSEITDSGTIETEPIFANRTSDELDDIDQQNKPDKDVLFTAKTTFNYTAMVINNYSAAFLIRILLTFVRNSVFNYTAMFTLPKNDLLRHLNWGAQVLMEISSNV